MLEVGAMIPAFSLPDQDGNIVSSEELRGKWCVIYFYPKDNTPGCTKEAKKFAELHDRFVEKGVKVIGISKDSSESHKKFANKYELPFTLISDREGELLSKFGVWKEKSMFGKTVLGIVRSTFIVDPEGKIAKVYPKVSPEKNPLEVVDFFDKEA